MSLLRFSFLQHSTISCSPLLTDIHFFHTLSCSLEFWTLINSLVTLIFRIASASSLSVLNCDIGQTSTFTSKVCLLTWLYVCVCLRPSNLKASSIWGWKSRVQINDVVLKTLFSSANFLHRYFSMNHQAFLTSRFILFAH